ncbi:activity-dependent neuroprotective protein 2a [Trichomycterus rosablanca]|uniref:activity-dependent neuroprotective protein 2a n=1 Tax=Trichomycterus rosablanca TaxID=2290929 RepID=UPI002F3538D4
MYQVPVKDVGKIRRSRKKVKNILRDIALLDCQELIKDYKPFDAGEGSFNNTEWSDFTDGHLGKQRKKWKYRTEALCCSLCKFSTRSFYAFRNHVQRCHEEERDIASLSNCPKCTFIGHPKITGLHIKYFHTTPGRPAPTVTQPVIVPAKTLPATASVVSADDRYSCVNCGYSDSLMYVMKKHVLVNHHATMLNRYFGLGLEKADGVPKSKYYCKECKLPAETIEHLLYHILSSDKHKELHWQVMPFIRERHVSGQNQGGKNVSVVGRPNVIQQTKQARGSAVPNSNGNMFLPGANNAAALLCSAESRQIFLSSQTPALLSAQQQNLATLPTSQVVKSLNMVVPGISQNVGKRVPMAMTVPRLSQAQSHQQVLFQPGLQVTVPGKAAIRPSILMTHRLQVNQPVPRPPIVASPSVRLVPTGNKVNGVPTYTLAPVQMTTVPVQSKTGQVVNSTPQNEAQVGRSSVPTLLVPAKPGPSSRNRVSIKSNRPNKLAVFAPFLKRQNDDTVKCLRCKVVLTEQWIFQHLLHGLRCLFCPLMFYSFKQIMEHSNKEHSLKVKENQSFIKKEFDLNCDSEGSLDFSTFSLNTNVPKDLLDNQELNLVLVTSAQEKIYIKMYPDSAKAVYPPSQKSIPTDCPVCHLKLKSSQGYEHHLKTVHHIVPTVHAILKSPAFKCIYCFGVYSEKSTPKTISIHVQRCRCAPKSIKDAEKFSPGSTGHMNGDLKNPIQQTGGLQQQSGKREAAAEKNLIKSIRAGKPNWSGPSVKLVLDPAGMEMRSYEDRKEFLTKYFHSKPYLSKMEMLTLAAHLWLNKSDVLSHFGTKRSRCMKAIQKRRTVVLLGFNMTEVNKLKHDLYIPEVASAV